jgi:hypothetical protein
MPGLQRIFTMSGRSIAVGVLAAAVASSVALPTASASASRMTKAQARTVAKHVNLTSADFRGFKVHPYQSSKGAKATQKQYAECLGLAPVFARAHSDAFDNGRGGIFSSVTELVKSRAAAKRDSQLAASARARQCLQQELKSIAAAVNAKDTKITVSPVTEAPIAGLDAIYAVKYTATFTILGYHGTLHGWSIGFSRGNLEVSLNEIGTMDVPRQNLNNALATLVARAKSQVPEGGLRVRR